MIIPLNEITQIIGRQLGIRQVNPSDHILHDLAAESVDILNIIATIEEKYNIFIDETTLATVQTVADLHHLTNTLLTNQ